jgi:glycosyltransferase involved in cell wall biosynthesis
MIMNLSIVIPVFNESENIDELVARLCKSMDNLTLDWEVIFVDDGSVDGTVDKLHDYSVEKENIRFLELLRNYGQSIAIRAGIEHTTGEIILCMDGDLQHRPEDIVEMVSVALNGYDLVSGYKDIESKQSIGSKIVHRVIAKTSKVNLRYFGISIKAFRRELINPCDLTGNMHRYIGISLSKNAKKIKEIPVHIDKRNSGQSSYQKNKYWSVLVELFSLRLLQTDLVRISKAMRTIGLLLSVLGIVADIVIIVLDLFSQLDVKQDFIVEFMFINFAIIFGLLLFFFGVLFHINQRESAKKPYVVRRFE